MKKHILNKVFAVISITVICTSCIIQMPISNLDPMGRPAVEFRTDDNQTEFVETRTAGGANLALSEVLIQEKALFGKDISFVNVVVQRRGKQVFYIYDVVRNKSTSQVSKTSKQ